MTSPADVVERFVKAWNDRDVEAMTATLSPDCEVSRPGGEVLRGKEQIVARQRQDWDSFPDTRIDIKLLVSEGTTVVEESTSTGTNTGPLHLPNGTTIPATGRQVVMPYATFWEVKDGLIVAVRDYWDNVAMLEQLGLLPTPAA